MNDEASADDVPDDAGDVVRYSEDITDPMTRAEGDYIRSWLASPGWVAWLFLELGAVHPAMPFPRERARVIVARHADGMFPRLVGAPEVGLMIEELLDDIEEHVDWWADDEMRKS